MRCWHAIPDQMKAAGSRWIEVLLGLALVLLLCACSSQNASAGPILPASSTPGQFVQETSLPEVQITPPVVKASLTPNPTPATCTKTRGKFDNIEVPNTSLTYPLKVKVYFPPCYTDKPYKPYPYIVMIHGMTYKNDQWDRLGADEAADEFISYDEAPPFLIFMPYEEQTTGNLYEDGFGDAIT
ncbi:MAG: hypothetical protein WCG34_12570, partial [Leptolinea sp.]